MRVAIISYEYPPDTGIGGIGTYTKLMAGVLKQRSFEVHLFVGSFLSSADSKVDDICIHQVKCSGPSDFQMQVLPVFKKVHQELPFDWIESPEIHANGLLLKKEFPHLKLHVRLHAPNYLVENYKKKYIPFSQKLRYFLGALRKGKWDLGYWRAYDYKNDMDYCFTAMADIISAPSVAMKDWVVAHWKINPKKIAVFDNPFVEMGQFANAVTNNEEKKIVFYGRLNVLKGLITATKAMKIVLKNNPDWKWLVIGEDGLAADNIHSMKSWMQQELKNVIQQVEFVHTVPNHQLVEYLSGVSIVLIPSLFESYSYITIEAMSAGKAIVGSMGTGISYILEQERTGLLVDPLNHREWIEAIQCLIKKGELRRKLGQTAFKEAAQIKWRSEDLITKFYSSNFN